MSLYVFSMMTDNEEIWSDEDDDEDDSCGSNPSLPYPIQLLLTFLGAWQYAFRISDQAMGALVAFVWQFLHFLSKMAGSEYLKWLYTYMPKNYKGC